MYTQAIADEICKRLMDGQSLRSILRDGHLPDKSTVFNWLLHNKQFIDQYTHAREVQAETFVDEMTDIADDGSNDYMEKITQSGEITHVPDHEHINRSRIRIDTRKWIAERMKPKKYFKPDTSDFDDDSFTPVKISFEQKDCRVEHN